MGAWVLVFISSWPRATSCLAVEDSGYSTPIRGLRALGACIDCSTLPMLLNSFSLVRGVTLSKWFCTLVKHIDLLVACGARVAAQIVCPGYT